MRAEGKCERCGQFNGRGRGLCAACSFTERQKHSKFVVTCGRCGCLGHNVLTCDVQFAPVMFVAPVVAGLLATFCRLVIADDKKD